MRTGRALGAVVAVMALAGGGWLGARAIEGDEGAARAAPLAPLPAAVSADGRRFLEDFVDPDGRVVRRDEAGDTVSEGQAYAMLVAVAIDDRSSFDRVWAWTEGNLRGHDGLLAWRWADGQVVDFHAAADADLDAAWALAIAARRWSGGGYARSARDLAAAVGRHETVRAGDGAAVLAAGPWAVAAPDASGAVAVNPSYASPVAEAVLAADHLVEPTLSRARLAGGRRMVGQLMDAVGVPTDWARMSPDGEVTPADGATTPGSGHFAWDAVRVPLRFAASCARPDGRLAARLWPAFESGAGVQELGDHPARLVGAAAAAAAADEPDRARALLGQASAAEQRTPTYYGSALTALGRILLTTDRLGGCPPLGH